MAQTAGVDPFPIAGRVASERERTLGMTPTERCWRKQWLQDQILDPNEPCDIPEYWKERLNPIRRIYTAVKLRTSILPILQFFSQTSEIYFLY